MYAGFATQQSIFIQFIFLSSFYIKTLHRLISKTKNRSTFIQYYFFSQSIYMKQQQLFRLIFSICFQTLCQYFFNFEGLINLIIKNRMKTNRSKNKIGLIYTIQTALAEKSAGLRQHRDRAGSIRGLTPKRISSLGKIVTRPFTPKKTLSIQIQTIDIIPIMQAKATQVQELLQAKIDKESDKEIKVSESGLRNSKNKPGLLKLADFNTLNEEADVLSKTIKKKCETLYNKENKQNIVQREDGAKVKTVKFVDNPEKNSKQLKQSILPVSILKEKQSITIKQTVKQPKVEGNRVGREQKISKLSALYQKNLARYQTSKTILGDLLKQNKTK